MENNEALLFNFKRLISQYIAYIDEIANETLRAFKLITIASRSAFQLKINNMEFAIVINDHDLIAGFMMVEIIYSLTNNMRLVY
ncbi:hypothetical protein C4Y67_022325 [Klebsiella pneumoniae subsp. pneumoniae]|nr:hypothetical protein C4Y67_022325 [Klebsiella pneumoniae subsp. pneumoniae]